MSGYYRIVCQVIMHCSGTTYSHFCLKHLAKKALRKANYPEIPPKTKKFSPGNFENKKRGVKNKNVKKIKGLLVLEDITPRTQSNLSETFVSNRYIFLNKC